jgi:hypothetical protein
MSYSKKQQKAVEKYCKVCHDAGKPESVYRSHFVRASPEPTAKVLCPTLLALECGFCGNCGHTPQYCKVLKDKQKIEKRQQAFAKADEKAAKPASKPAKVQTNVFAAFADDSDDEEQITVSNKPSVNTASTKSATIIKKDEFPALQASAAVKSAKSATKMSAVPSCVAALQACHPGLSVAKKMPEVTLAKPSLGRVVSAKLAIEQQDNRIIEQEDEEFSDEDNTITAIYDQAVAITRAPLKASQMNWAALDSDDSDDEDW